MWLDEQGVIHTVSIPRSRNPAAPQISRALALLSNAQIRRLSDLIDESLHAIAGSGASALRELSGNEAEAAPDSVVVAVDWAKVLTPPFDLSSLVDSEPWRIDLLFMLDELTPSPR